MVADPARHLVHLALKTRAVADDLGPRLAVPGLIEEERGDHRDRARIRLQVVAEDLVHLTEHLSAPAPGRVQAETLLLGLVGDLLELMHLEGELAVVNEPPAEVA